MTDEVQNDHSTTSRAYKTYDEGTAYLPNVYKGEGCPAEK